MPQIVINPVVFAISAGLFAGILLLAWVGYVLRWRNSSVIQASFADPERIAEVILLVFVVVMAFFCIDCARSHSEAQFRLILDESNAINRSFSRLDLLNVQNRDALRRDFRKYVEARVDGYRRLPDSEAALGAWDKALGLQTQIWKKTVTLARQEDSNIAVQLILPELNRMMEVSHDRYVAIQRKPCLAYTILLGVFALMTALATGVGTDSLKPARVIGLIALAVAVTSAFYFILNVEYPRGGILHPDISTRAMTGLLQSMEH